MKNFNKILILVPVITSCIFSNCKQVPSRQEEKYNNIAYCDSTVRFTIITDGVIRMEYDSMGIFNDNRSFVAVERLYPKADFSISVVSDTIKITTSKMILTYKKDSGKISSDNLKIESAEGFFPFSWHPGMQQKGNLKGTCRTLDDVDGDVYTYMKDKNGNFIKLTLEDGLIATDGWTFIDDSRNFLFDNSEWAWVVQRADTSIQDMYFMAYGHDYKAALKDFTVFAGKVPLPPRYAFGYWWSRYWAYTDNELRNFINNIQTHNIPLDVLVIDMDWHYTEPGKGAWTGFTWNKRLFPEPSTLLSDLKKNNLKLTLNLHPAMGVAFYEENYKSMAKLMGKEQKKDTIKYLGSNKSFMTAWYNAVLRPLEKMGVDFWWLDWQQKLYDDSIKQLNNTWWINYATFSDMERNRNSRPLLYHRWGGLGNHRYQIGFSGDAIISWKSLEYQTYFNSTASNVLYGYWSHDLGGHYYGDSSNTINPEMYIRWMQFGAVSPIMRTHSSKDGNLNKEFWAFNNSYFEILRNTVIQRYELVPYIYTMARKTYETGISLCRPMYYDYPENEESYYFKNEYMFGDDILVAPITSPMNDDYYSQIDVWLPSGNDWYEWHTGTLLNGNQTVKRFFALDEYPIYFKAGAIIPMYDNTVKELNNNDEKIILTIIPGGNGEFELYEDNGNDKSYALNYAKTNIKSERKNNELKISIATRRGKYANMPSNRTYVIKVLASGIPQQVTINRKKVDFTYCGDELALIVEFAGSDCFSNKEIKITYPSEVPYLTDGLVGIMHRIQKAVYELKYRNPLVELGEELGTMESTNREISYYPERLSKSIEKFRYNYLLLPQVLKTQIGNTYSRELLSEPEQQWFLKRIAYKKD